MHIGRLIKYIGIGTVAGGIGFLAGGGELPIDLDTAPQQLAERARDAVDELENLEKQDAPITEALNALRDRFVEGARRLAGYVID